MGLLDRVSQWVGGGGARGQPLEVLVLGLDHSGKTALLHALDPDHRDQSDPDHTYHITSGGMRLCAVEGGGGGAARRRALWERRYAGARALVWVADAADALRLCVARDELQRALAHPALAHRPPLLVLANKADLPGALTPAQVSRALGLERAACSWHVAACSARDPAALHHGLAWLVAQLRHQQLQDKQH